MKNTSGIYAIVHSESGKRYIGSAIKMSRRIQEHKRGLNGNKHPNRYLQAAWIKYGSDSFGFFVVEYCVESKLLQKEQFYINERAEFNLSPTAGRTTGVKHRPEAIEANRERARLLWKDPAFQEKQRAMAKVKGAKLSISLMGRPGAMAGKKHSQETIDKIRASNIGQKRSPECIEHIRQSQLGKKMSPESIEKTAAANRGRTASESTKAAISMAQRRVSSEQRRINAIKAWETKRANKYKASKHTEETKNKMREARSLIIASLTHEQLSARACKAWETKRAKENILCQAQ
jgi:group I intron endonuclease